MLLALGIFTLSNIISMLTSHFAVLLIARALPAFLHPVYVSMAFTVAASSVSKEKAPKAVAKVFIGVSAGMVLGVPVTSYIASEVSFPMGMMFFTAVNTLVFIATILFVPSMPVKERYAADIRTCQYRGKCHCRKTTGCEPGTEHGFCPVCAVRVAADDEQRLKL